MRNVFSVFNNIWEEIARFFKTESLFTYLLIFAVLVYGTLFLTQSKKLETPSKAMQQIQLAEEKLKEEGQVEVIKQYLLEKAGPFELFLLLGVPSLLFAALIAGFLLNTYFLGKALKGKEIIPPLVPEPRVIPWQVRDIVKASIFVMFVGIVLSLFLSLLQKVLWGGDKAHGQVFLIVHTLLLDISLLLFICFTVKKYGEPLASLGIRLAEWGRDLWIGITGYLTAMPPVFFILFSVVMLARLISFEPEPHPLVEIFVEQDYKNPALIAFSIFFACTIGPFIEEIFFRGFCYPAFKKRWGQKWAMILSAGFFAAIHGSAFAFLPVFVLGLIFAYVYERRRSLIPSIVMHMMHNTIFIGYFFILKRYVLDQIV